MLVADTSTAGVPYGTLVITFSDDKKQERFVTLKSLAAFLGMHYKALSDYIHADPSRKIVRREGHDSYPLKAFSKLVMGLNINAIAPDRRLALGWLCERGYQFLANYRPPMEVEKAKPVIDPSVLLGLDRQIGGDRVCTYLASELHRFLGSSMNFDEWAKARIVGPPSDWTKYMHEHKQYEIIFNAGPGGRVDYALTLDACKHICQMEDSPVGRSSRDWFQQKEQELREVYASGGNTVSLLKGFFSKIASFFERSEVSMDTVLKNQAMLSEQNATILANQVLEREQNALRDEKVRLIAEALLDQKVTRPTRTAKKGTVEGFRLRQAATLLGVPLKGYLPGALLALQWAQRTPKGLYTPTMKGLRHGFVARTGGGVLITQKGVNRLKTYFTKQVQEAVG